MNDFVIANNYHVDNTLHVSGPGAELKRFLNEKWATLNRAEIGIGEYSIDEDTAEKVSIMFDSYSDISKWVIRTARLFPELRFFLEWTWFEDNDGVWEYVSCEGIEAQYTYSKQIMPDDFEDDDTKDTAEDDTKNNDDDDILFWG